MREERGLLIGVLWRVAVMLLLFNPVASLSQWMLASWRIRPGHGLAGLGHGGVAVQLSIEGLHHSLSQSRI